MLRLVLLSLFLVACAAPSDASPRVGSGTVAAGDGVEIAWDSRGAGETAIVFVHGWVSDRNVWRNQVNPLAEGYRVVTLDLPGCGRSGTQRAEWSVQVLGDDVARVVDSLGLRRVVLVGHSLGGQVCLAAAARLRGKVLGIVGIDTLHDVEYRFTQQLVGEMNDAYAANYPGQLDLMVRSVFPADTPAELVDWTVERALMQDQLAALSVLRSYVQLDMAGLVAAADVPVRCLNAGADAKDVPTDQVGKVPTTQVARNRRYGDFDARFLPGRGHYLMLTEPDAVTRAVREWTREFEQRQP
ncbi:MAG: hypothetical protein RL148_255 [Planctomycetota bacterium]|jgi:pimeloyl-ACP methyl ester carboxylesterase